MGTFKLRKKYWVLLIRLLLYSVFSIISFILLFYFAIKLPATQRFITGKAEKYLIEKIHTKVSIGAIELALPKAIAVKEFYLEDLNQDTLIYFKNFEVDINAIGLLQKKIQVNYLELDGVVGKLKREQQDNMFNYSFIPNSFQSESPEPSKEESPWKIELYELQLGNARLHYLDFKDTIDLNSKLQRAIFHLNGYDLSQTLTNVTLTTKGLNTKLTTTNQSLTFSLDSYACLIDSLNLDQSSIYITKFGVSKPSLDYLSFVTKAVQKKTKEPSKISLDIPWTVSCVDFQITDGSLSYKDASKPILSRFDPNHINIQDFTMSVVDVHLQRNNFKTQLNSLTFTEGKYLKIQNISGKLALTDRQIRLDRLLLETRKSKFDTDLKIDYSKLEDLTLFPDKLKVNHVLRRSNVGYSDLRYFLPSDSLNLPIDLTNDLSMEWSIHGNSKDLQVDKLQFFDKGIPISLLSGSFEQILKPDSLIFNMQLEAYNGLFKRLAKLDLPIQEKMKWPNNMSLKTKICGSMANFSFENELLTDVGHLQANGHYINSNGPAYQADLLVKNLNLGFLLDNPDIGNINTDFQLEGEGISIEQHKSSWKGNISSLEYLGYQYSSGKIKGNIQDQVVNMNFTVDDPNLQLAVSSLIDLKNPLMHAKVDLDIQKAELQLIGLLSDDIQTYGDFTFDIVGNNLDSLQFSVRTENSRVVKEGVNYETSPIVLDAQFGGNSSFIDADFPFLKAFLKSNFAMSQFQCVLTEEIIPMLLSGDTSTVANDQQFEFGISQLKPKIISNLLIPDLKDIKLREFRGSYDGQSKELHLLLDIPHITYKDIDIDTILIAANSIKSGINFTASLKQFTRGKFASESILILGNSSDGVANISLDLTDSLKRNSLSFGTHIIRSDSGYQITINRNSVILAYENWSVHQDNLLNISSEGINFQNFNFAKSNQSFSIHSESQIKNSNIQTIFKGFELTNISKFVSSPDKRLSGILHGEILFNDLDQGLAFESDITIENLVYVQDTLGTIHFKVDNKVKDKYDLLFSLKGKNTSIKGNGFYTSQSDSIDMRINLEELDISTFGELSSDYLKNLKGQLTGHIDVIGDVKRPSLKGKIYFNEVSFNTVYLGAYCRLKNESITLDNGNIYFNQFKIEDKNDNTAHINGFVGSSDFESYIFNLDLTTEKFQVLDTKSTSARDELYFGKLITSSKLKIRGNSKQPQIDARINVIEGSELTIIVPEKVTETIEHEGVVRFVSKDEKIQPLDSTITKLTGLTGVSLDADLELSPNAKLKIILDREAGDFLEVKGKSALSYSVSPSGEASLSGTYEVIEGVYELTFYNFVKKQFALKKGSKIRWTGDPYNAQLESTATFTVNTSPLPLVESQLTSSGVGSRDSYSQILPFIVGLKIGGEIKSPIIHFEIDLPAETRSFQGGAIAGKIQQLNAHESELNKQVFSLLLFNRFLPENSFTGGASSVVSSTARNSVSQLLTQQLNRLSGKYIKGITVNMDVRSFEDYSTGSARGRSDLKLELSKELFHEKLIVKIGSNVTLEGDQKQNGVRNLAQDIVLEYKLDEDGSYRLKAFRKNQYEGVIDGELTKTGIGMSLSQEFETWQEFFMALKIANKK